MCFLQNQNNINNFIDLNPKNYSTIKLHTNHSDQLTQELLSAIRSAFDIYISKCSNTDEVNPITGECHNPYGFSATLLESLETFALFEDHTYLKKARSYIAKFSCRKLGWVNRHELWSRGIGGLIGAYQLTHDPLYLSKAIECADLSIAIDSRSYAPNPLFHMTNLDGRLRAWENGTALSDITAGLPELIVLHNLTQNNKYHQKIKQIIANIPDEPDGKYYIMYKLINKKNASQIQRIDGFTIGFFHNLILANALNKGLKLGEKINKFVPNVVLWNTDNSSILHQLLYAETYLEDDQYFPNRNELIACAIEDHRSPRFRIFALGSSYTLMGFKFEASVLRLILRGSAQADNSDYNNIFRKVINESVVRTKAGKGYVGFRHSNLGRISKGDIQHSNFLGQWMLTAGLYVSHLQSLTLNTVFNERGHILSGPDF